MTTEFDEETPAPKVVNWDAAEEKEFEKLKSEMDKYKDKIIELDSKADELRSKLDKTTENTQVHRITHPTKIIWARTPESPLRQLCHFCVEVLKVILLLIISLLLGLNYIKENQTMITYQTTTTNTGKEYKIVSAHHNPEGKLQELTSDGWELINGGYIGGLHTMYLSRQNATTYVEQLASTDNAKDWEYKIVLWDTTYVEDCQTTTAEWERDSSDGGYGTRHTRCYCGDSPCYAELGPDVINPNGNYDREKFGLVPDPGTTCNTCGPRGSWKMYGSAESKSSFVNTAMKEGLTRDELFTQCNYPTSSRTIKFFYYKDEYSRVQWYDLTDEQYGASHYGFTPIEITVGVSIDVVEMEAVSCVLEKLVNRIAEDGWEFTDGGFDYQNFRRPKAR